MKKMLIVLLIMLGIGSLAFADTFPIDRRDCRTERGEIEYIVITGWYNQWRDNECYTGYHRAYDIPAVRGAKVRAVKAGKVVEIGYDYPRIRKGVWVNGYGNYIDIQDADGNVYRYAHLETSAQIDEGSFVSEGQYIARVGATGLCNLNGSPRFAYHLHIEKKDKNGNKIAFLKDFDVQKDSRGLAFATR